MALLPMTDHWGNRLLSEAVAQTVGFGLKRVENAFLSQWELTDTLSAIRVRMRAKAGKSRAPEI